jgi:hypothetical protein
MMVHYYLILVNTFDNYGEYDNIDIRIPWNFPVAGHNGASTYCPDSGYTLGVF